MKKCEQCQNPHYDGICSCGGWGDEEEAKANDWYESQSKVVSTPSRRNIASEINKTMTERLEELEAVWENEDERD